MGARSRLLYEIEEALKTKGIYQRIDSVPELRALFPGYRCALDLKGLKQFLEAIPSADLDRLRTTQSMPPGPAQSRFQERRTIKILRWRSEGRSVRGIADDLGVSKQRIYAILNKGKSK